MKRDNFYVFFPVKRNNGVVEVGKAETYPENSFAYERAMLNSLTVEEWKQRVSVSNFKKDGDAWKKKCEQFREQQQKKENVKKK